MTASDLAVACLLVRAAPVESRHDYLLDIAGALIRAHQDAADRIHHAVAQQILGKLYNKAEGDRLLDETAARIARKDPACGWPRLVERIGEKRARSVAHWLGFVPGEERPHRRGTAAQPNEWPDPGELPSGLPAVEPFDPVMLPERLRTWVEDIAERMQAPLDFPAIGAMTCLGAAVGRRIAIRPKEHDDWTVVPNLWGGIVGRPGLLKTPALQEACGPLIRLEMAAKDEFKRAQAEYEAQQRIDKQQKKLQDDKIAKDLKTNRDPKGILHDLLAEGDADPQPVRHRYLVNDSTIEKLGEILSQNPNGVLIFRDELTGFLRQMERDGHEQDRAFYLEAWNGTGRFTYDRIGRGTIDIEACCVSLLGGIQPGPLASYLQAMARGGEGDDGLIQRLQLMVWPDIPKAWRNVDRAPDLTARRDVVRLFEGVEDIVARAKTTMPTPEELEPGQHKAEEREEDPKRPKSAIPYLRFDWEAQRAFNAWREKLELRLRDDSLHPALEAHLAKYRSLIPSLALLFHIADARPDIELGPVGIEAFDAAEAWSDYLESHAKRVYNSVIRADMWGARVLGQHIKKGDLTSPFTLRDVYRPCWAGLDGAGAAEAAVEVLIGIDWLCPEVPTQGSQGGRPSPKYHINPKVMGAPT